MIDERREAQASLYALGALSADELPDFEQALRGNFELQLLVQEFRSTTEMLPFGLPIVSAPAGIKHSVMAAIGGDKALPPVGNQKEAAIFPAWLPWLLVGCLSLLCIALVGLGASFRRQSGELSEKLDQSQQAFTDLQHQHEELQGRLTQTGAKFSGRVAELEKQLIQKVEEAQHQKMEFRKQLDKSAAEVLQIQRQKAAFENQLRQASRELDRLRNNEPASTIPAANGPATLQVGLLKPTTDGPPGASGTAIWDNSQQKGLLLIENLPAPPSGNDYQLWLFDRRTGTPMSAGVFATGDATVSRLEFRTAIALDAGEKFTITVERKGGTSSPQGRVILAAN